MKRKYVTKEELEKKIAGEEGGFIGTIAVLVFLIAGLLVYSMGLKTRIVGLNEKLPYSVRCGHQKLATECYVDKKMSTKQYDGYFYSTEGPENAMLVLKCDILETRPTEYKVRYNGYMKIEWTERNQAGHRYTRESWDWENGLEKWIPKKDFHKYYTLEELSEKLNKTGE